MLSPHPADPTLTTDNLMEVVKGVEHCWNYLGNWLDVPLSKMKKVGRFYHSDHHSMEAVLDYYIKHHPEPSWDMFAERLQLLGLHKQA